MAGKGEIDPLRHTAEAVLWCVATDSDYLLPGCKTPFNGELPDCAGASSVISSLVCFWFGQRKNFFLVASATVEDEPGPLALQLLSGVPDGQKAVDPKKT
jgi:hypothetical protein